MLRKSPRRTARFIKANRRNAKKATGPRTPEGKAMSSLNALKHGAYTHVLEERLLAAGHRESAGFLQTVRREIEEAFAPWHLAASQLDRLAAQVWVMARQAGVLGRRPRSPGSPSARGGLENWPFRIRMESPGGRVALIYWVQRKRRNQEQNRLIGLLRAGEIREGATLRFATESKIRRRIVGLPKWNGKPAASGGQSSVISFPSQSPASVQSERQN